MVKAKKAAQGSKKEKSDASSDVEVKVEDVAADQVEEDTTTNEDSKKRGKTKKDTAGDQVDEETTTNEDSNSKKRGKAKKEETCSQEDTQDSEEAKENGEVATEKKKPPPEKKGKASKRAASSTPASEPARKSSRVPKPIAKQNGEGDSFEKFKEDRLVMQSPKKRSASKSPAKTSIKKAKSTTKDYEVEEVVGVRVKNGKKEFKIRWKGYKASDDTWEPEKNLSCQDLIKSYLAEHKDDIENITKKLPAKKTKTPAKKAKGRKGGRAK